MCWEMYFSSFVMFGHFYSVFYDLSSMCKLKTKVFCFFILDMTHLLMCF